MRSYRVLLAPLRFGAGLKGKVVDAWAHGLPVCTTPIGAEGMHGASGGGSEGAAPEHGEAVRSLCWDTAYACAIESETPRADREGRVWAQVNTPTCEQPCERGRCCAFASSGVYEVIIWFTDAPGAAPRSRRSRHSQGPC
jgi:hypothetical protein